ncbi:MarC family NAAT transporter [Bordetella sp. 02P26C-1]|uniref:MarC family NAAT transporter n=1 Tax=Bordetella sp. 02P26C-1 TaxID=2683195 RepID=UPI0013549643|nr:MarC family NAAT transporter [Bordetella sp. 02P26C-1]
MLIEYLKLVGLGLFTLLPLANPLTSVTLLLALGRDFTHEERNRQVDRSTLYVLAIILVCFYAGHAIISGFGISIPGLRIAGGLIVAYIGFGMLFPASTQSETDAQINMAPETTVHLDTSHGRHRPPPRDISFIPLALPGTAGPGTIALIISNASAMHSGGALHLWQHLAVITVAVLIAGIFWICMRSAEQVTRFLGQSGIDAVSRIMGFLLICMGVQIIINGIFELMGRPVPA